MIRHYDELTKLDMQHKGGKGHILAAELLNGEDFAGKGRVFNHCVLKPGCSVGRHRHVGDFEVYHVLSGTGLYFDNGELKPVTAGDVMICKEGEEHMLENDGTEDLEFIALILYAGSAFQHPKRTGLSPEESFFCCRWPVRLFPTWTNTV